jgi:hypothetical protein
MHVSRRTFLAAGAGVALSPFAGGSARAPKRVAAVNTIYFRMSHAYHVVGRMVNGYTVKGKHHQPDVTVARMYTQQYFTDGTMKDVSRPLAKKAGIQIVDSIPDALGGKDPLDVDAVLLIGEHGQYKRNERGQILYPRYEFFQEIVKVFDGCKRVVPLFCDKHLSYDANKAKAMYDTTKKMGVPFMAGSSLPVTFRRPEWEMPFGEKVEEAVVCHYGDMEIYGFHGLETLQCLMERRKGGETGVKNVATLKGDAVWKAWDRGAWNKDLAEAALRRSATRDFGKPSDYCENPVAISVEYKDGTKATVLNLHGYVADITVAVKLANDPKPRSTLFVLPAPPGARFFDALTFYIEELIATGKSPYPVERTLLTTTMLDFAHRSAADGGKPLSDPLLDVKYAGVDKSFFFRGPYSDD